MAAKKAAEKEKKLKITLIKSTIGQVPKARATVAAMGLRKIGQTVELPDNGSTKGQIQRVRHMVKVEEA
ncbi:MAG: 50S ribosomal protein L30 [Bacillus sp. (in: Bacteria)]|nr:50S ribosomal protein L30 [Bacillus sp. (in: firmicutes)]MCM1425215.1 50S ribosomal protein L30 [Eubacterium sp.]